jgi:hypothetical protein
VPVGQVDRETRIAGLRVDDARAPDHECAQPAHLHAGGPAGTVDHTADRLDRVGRAVRVDADLGDHAPGDVGDPGAHPVEFHIEPGDVGAGGNDGVESGVRPAAAFLLADDRNQAAPLQPGQHLGHGDLGDPGLLTDLVPGQRSSGKQQVKGGAVVELAQQTWRTRSALHRGPSPRAVAPVPRAVYFIIPTMMKSLMQGANFTATVDNINTQLQNVLNTGSMS